MQNSVFTLSFVRQVATNSLENHKNPPDNNQKEMERDFQLLYYL